MDIPYGFDCYAFKDFEVKYFEPNILKGQSAGVIPYNRNISAFKSTQGYTDAVSGKTLAGYVSFTRKNEDYSSEQLQALSRAGRLNISEINKKVFCGIKIQIGIGVVTNFLQKGMQYRKPNKGRSELINGTWNGIVSGLTVDRDANNSYDMAFGNFLAYDEEFPYIKFGPFFVLESKLVMLTGGSRSIEASSFGTNIQRELWLTILSLMLILSLLASFRIYTRHNVPETDTGALLASNCSSANIATGSNKKRLENGVSMIEKRVTDLVYMVYNFFFIYFTMLLNKPSLEFDDLIWPKHNAAIQKYFQKNRHLRHQVIMPCKSKRIYTISDEGKSFRQLVAKRKKRSKLLPTSIRILSYIWSAACLVMASIYSGEMLAVILLHADQNIDTISQLINSKPPIEPVIRQDDFTYNLMLKSLDKNMLILHNMTKIIPRHEVYTRQFIESVSKRKQALLGDDELIGTIYEIYHKYFPIHISKITYLQYPISIMYRMDLNASLESELRRGMVQIFEMGLIHRWYQAQKETYIQFYDSDEKKNDKKEKDLESLMATSHQKYKPLSMQHFQSFFKFMLLCIIFAFIMLVLEIIHSLVFPNHCLELNCEVADKNYKTLAVKSRDKKISSNAKQIEEEVNKNSKKEPTTTETRRQEDKSVERIEQKASVKNRQETGGRLQQIAASLSSTSKGTRPPTFGGAPQKLSRLPYFSYFGRARNVDLLSSTDRDKGDKLLDIHASEGSTVSIGSSRSSLSKSDTSRIPTLSRGSQIKEPIKIDEQSGRLNLRNRYNNISNLYPDKSMSDHRTSVSSSGSIHQNFRSARKSHDGSIKHQLYSSLNLNQGQGTRTKYQQASSGQAARFAQSALNRQNSLIQHNTCSSSKNRSLNSLKISPSSNETENLTQTAMRRLNSGSTNTGIAPQTRQRRSTSLVATASAAVDQQGRPLSALGYTTNRHCNRWPSASSLYYGSVGMSPYGPAPDMPAGLDPSSQMHGYSTALSNRTVNKSNQRLASDMSIGADVNADLLYELYPDYYSTEHPLVYDSGSLYSPTSPTFMIRRPESAHGSPATHNKQAYYNHSSRFSQYHSPNDGIRSSSLAPTNEQLRRILGYKPHTRPVHLHPQWAYSRPFIHLEGRSPSLSAMNGVEHARFAPYNQLQDTQAIRAVDFHPSGEVYAIGSNSRSLRICAYPADNELRHFGEGRSASAPRVLFKFLQFHRGSIYCVSFNRTGQLLATGSNDQTVHIVRYNPTTHSPDGDEYRLTVHDGTVRDLCFIDDTIGGSSLLLSAGGGDNKIYVTDCDTITPFQSMAGHTQTVMALHHWGGASFVSASQDRSIRFWDLRTRACTSIVSAPPSNKWATGPGAPVCSVKVEPSGRLLASGHTDSTCMLYDIRGARIIQAFKPHEDEIRTVSFSPKAYYLLTGGYDGRIVLTDLQADLTQPMPNVCVVENDGKIVQAKWHPSDFTFVTTSADKTATLWAMPSD